MSWLGQGAVVVLLLLVFSQFGQRLQARNAGAWWAMASFICVAAIDPELLRPLTNILGIKLVSNFVLATLSMFLFVQLIEQNSEVTASNRKFRRLTSKLAVSEYCATQGLRQVLIKPSILVILPCFNEQESIPVVAAELSAMCESTGDLAIDFCFVNDGSTDNTAEVLRKTIGQHFASHGINVGVSAVLITGCDLALARGYDYLVQCDSDGQHPVVEIPRLVRFARDNQTDLVIGSRFVASRIRDDVVVPGVSNDLNASTTGSRLVGISFIRIMLAFFGKSARVKDPTSGLRVYSKRAVELLLKQMPDEYPEPESIALLALNGARIAEVPVTMRPRTTGQSSLSGLKSVRYMIKVGSALFGLRLRALVATSRKPKGL